MESNIQIHAKFDRTKEGREKRTVSRARAAPGAGPRSPHQGTQLRRRRLLKSEAAELCQSERSEIMRAIHAVDLIPQKRIQVHGNA
ncbi:unnamed protein product [Rangifer tarandus platyrhynchus]|uniref:Uncharacterized protein n=2 Tax=Rangifer tarandus platyrhynchus TaxID=3082113 RepID=A0ACB0ENL9_RANTA|nr:unnamed protein product [Rangifer tarandus platyrhynchus]CAI9701716.1 unnamed protein product [Rangifer tarandus platyrhynchus]